MRKLQCLSAMSNYCSLILPFLAISVCSLLTQLCITYSLSHICIQIKIIFNILYNFRTFNSDKYVAMPGPTQAVSSMKEEVKTNVICHKYDSYYIFRKKNSAWEDRRGVRNSEVLKMQQRVKKTVTLMSMIRKANGHILVRIITKLSGEFGELSVR